MASDVLYLRAGELLAYAAGLLGDISRAYVALAQPALDCPDQLTVHVAQYAKQPGGGGGRLADYTMGLSSQLGSVNVAVFVITIVRCAPTSSDTGQPPSTQAYELVSAQVLADLWNLWHGIPRGIVNGELWPGVCEQIALGPATPVAESGGYYGWALPISGEVITSG